MPEETNPYAAVLADLERERDQISGMIAMMKRRMGLSVEDGPVTTAVASNHGSRDTAEIRSDTFFGMGIADAIRKYLGMAKRPQRASEIAKALDEGGLLHSSKSWLATVQTTLTRMKGVVVRVPNGWGLMEWYPGRNFDKQGPSKPKKKKRTKKSVPAQSAKVPPKAPEAAGVSLDASRRLQGQYLGLLKKIPEERRGTYKVIAKQDGREKAINVMEHDLGIK
jgi:hypothetical protein